MKLMKFSSSLFLIAKNKLLPLLDENGLILLRTGNPVSKSLTDKSGAVPAAVSLDIGNK